MRFLRGYWWWWEQKGQRDQKLSWKSEVAISVELTSKSPKYKTRQNWQNRKWKVGSSKSTGGNDGHEHTYQGWICPQKPKSGQTNSGHRRTTPSVAAYYTQTVQNFRFLSFTKSTKLIIIISQLAVKTLQKSPHFYWPFLKFWKKLKFCTVRIILTVQNIRFLQKRERVNIKGPF